MKDYDTADDWYADTEGEQAPWLEVCAALRKIALSLKLDETIKWKHPCYMDAGKNILIIGTRKAGAVASLVKGALVDDPRGRLVQPGRERSGRYMPFATVAEVKRDRAYLKKLIQQAIENERAGKKIEALPDEIAYVPELQARLDDDARFRAAFEALTPGRRREYNFHLEKAKKPATRVARIDKNLERIMQGRGLKDCICGRSKRMPRCDGSHNST